MSISIWQKKVDKIIAQRGKTRSSLLPCLETIQEINGYVPPEQVSYLRDTLDVSAADIYGVISFYGMLTVEKQGKYIIRLCDSLPCNLNHSEKVLEVLEGELGIKAGQTTGDKKFTLELVSCLGLCDQSPAMMINEHNYGNLTVEKVKQIIKELKDRG
jgi:NADH-quinone oxidoreductase subunit E